MQRGYVLITVVTALFLLATVAVLLTHGSSIGANTASSELQTARADYVAQAAMQHALWRAQNNACMGDVTIPATALGPDSYDATITGADAGTAYVLTADQDAWIRNDDPTKNNGTNADQHIRFEGGNIEHALTRFDLSALPSGAQINSAVVWVYVSTGGASGGKHPEGPISVHRVTADWTETGATWENTNGAYETSFLATIPAQEQSGVWVSFNLTAQVQAWVNGQSNHGILFASTTEGVHGKYSSREDGANAPRLEVVVGSGSPSPVTISATGTLANGLKRKLKDKVATAYQPPTWAVLQPDATGTEDAWITAGQTAWNYGAHGTLRVQPNNQRTFLRMDLQGHVPLGARVTEATLELYVNQINTADAIDLHNVIRAWAEGTCFGNCGTNDGVTWDTYDGTNIWANPGGDMDAAAAATAAPTAAGDWLSWDITELAAEWATDPSANFGVMLKGNPGSAVFLSSDDADPTLRPRISISYACECGTPCMTPSGAGNVLMVVAEKTWLNDNDETIHSLLEAWGYTVTLISDHDNQNTFDGGFASNDVVFVSESVDTSKVGSKLNNVPIGVVNAEGWLNDELGFESGDSSNWPVGSAIEVTDPSHYITAAFRAGPLDIYDADMGGLAIDNTPAGGLQPLADWEDDSGLAVLDAGATTAGGTSVAGRRVLLPFGRNASMNWSLVNNSGHLILQRAINWAMASAAIPSTGSLLLVVVDPANLTVQEATKKTLIESWGFTVNLIDEAADPAKFVIAFGENDVVYVTEDVTASNVGTKLTNAPIGVVTEEANLVADLGLGDGIAWDSSVKMAILTNSHYITQPFAVGSIALLNTTESLAYQTPNLAPDLQQLARSDSGPGLTAIPAAAELVSGNPAAGRRVMLPWGGNNMDVNYLTADGLTIFRRALEWGAGAGCGSTVPLLMIVGDATNPTAEELSREFLLSSWCYSIKLMTASEPQEVYDKYVFDSDVVYVPSSVYYADVGNKLKLQPIGIVNEVGTLTAYLGFTSGSSGYTGTMTELVNNAHYITSDLPVGDLTLTTTATSLRHFVNTMGPGFSTLSVRPTQTDPMIMTLDAGDELLWGGNAPDRRVMLPWGGSSTFDVNNLSPDGETILRRSLEWAAGANKGPIAHWKLDETSGLTAVDSEGGHDGTLVYMDPFTDWVPGQVGGGLDFDGSNDFVDLSAHAATFNNLTEGSIAVWINRNMSGSGQSIFALADANDSESYVSFRITVSNQIKFQVQESNTDLLNVTSAAIIPEGEWHHVVVTVDSGGNTLYVDGVAAIVSYGAGNASSTQFFDDVNTTDYAAIGQEKDNSGPERWFGGLIDDVRLYDRALAASEVAAIAAAGGSGGSGGGGGPAYVELYESFSATSSNTWQTADLSTYGVPANAVVELALQNSNTSSEREAGARAVGSSVDRRFDLHEAESGGVDAVVVHVQTDSNSRIQVFAESTSNINYQLLGYWTGASYTELAGLVTANSSGFWQSRDLAAYGVSPGQIVEIAIQNTSASSEQSAGVRKIGSTLNRIVNVHEAESGGNDYVSFFVEASSDAAASIEIYAQNSTSVEFKIVGAWYMPPGAYVEAGGIITTANQADAWHSLSAAASGIPANAILQMALANDNSSAERQMGLRSTGSSLNRIIDLQEGESGGADIATFHVNLDSSAQFELYVESSTAELFFYPLGWWVPN